MKLIQSTFEQPFDAALMSVVGVMYMKLDAGKVVALAEMKTRPGQQMCVGLAHNTSKTGQS